MALRASAFRHSRYPAVAAAAFCALVLIFGCGREDVPDEVERTAPIGTILELEGKGSITTDVNAKAPAFARRDSTGQTIRTQDFIGNQVLLLDFWSVFCQSCLQEIPFLQELHREYSDDGLQIVSINTDFFPLARIESFMKKTGIIFPFPMIHDRDQSLSKLFQVDALPVTVLIDSAGWIRMVHFGYRPSDEKTIESRVRKACRKIRETVVTLQPVEGKTAFAPPERKETILAPGAVLPDPLAADAAGAETSFSRVRADGPSIIFFWSLFCQPCRKEFPELVSLAERYSSQGVPVIAVNVDSEKLLPAARTFAAKEGEGLVTLFENYGGREAGLVSEALGVRYTPSIFLVDAGGTILFSGSGEASAAEIEALVENLLAGAGGGPR